jgi:isoleucyl-tRNA synthetase
MESEKELKVSGRAQIVHYGIERFNAHCRSSVQRYTKEWENYVTRQARWVSFENAYRTMDLPFMESVIWAFQQLWKKGLIYEGFRVLPYSWACESPVSNFETRLDNAYRERQDPAITVLFTLDPQPGDEMPTKILVWTTTPWTLPSNLALAVGADIDYAVLEEDGVRYVIGDAVRAKYQEQLKKAALVGVVKGRELVGRTYRPLFPYFADTPNAFRVLAGDFVDTEEGTGVVHIAPGFGEDDQILAQANGISLVCPVDNSGRFTSEVPPYEGMLVFDANKEIIQEIKRAHALVKHETYMHMYPHCWRTDTPLIYKALSSWYVKVTAIRDRMIEVNREITWIPSHIRDGLFGKWLEGARDWSISRNRFWGTPIPVWKSDDPRYPRLDVYGSLDELERDFGVRPSDLHRPFVDTLVRPNPDDPTGQSTMRRTEEVLDCWFESGSMPFAQVHYPFENREWFETHFPADFIVEYVAQTRGWFYTLVVLSTALFDKPPFSTCICHGVVLDENGQKLSKRLRNYPSPEEVFSSYGADALRWFLVSSAIFRGNDLQIDREGKAIADVVRLVINPIWNAYYFFCLYANADGVKAEFRTDARGTLDRYVLAKAHDLVADVTRQMDAYDLPGACATITSFVDVLNNWYIRRSRDRFWGTEMTPDRRDAYDTLYTILTLLARVSAPLLPLLMEEVYKGLTGEKSVHLTDWPGAAQLPPDRELARDMDHARDVCSKALGIRKARNLRVRLPLASLTVAGRDAGRLAPYVPLIQDEVNVKRVELADTMEDLGDLRLTVNARILGAKLGHAMKQVMAASRSGHWRRLDDGRVEVGGHVLEPGEFELRLVPRDETAAQPLSTNDAIVTLDVRVTPDLEEEGVARDLVRLIQQARRDSGIHVSDRIRLSVHVPDALQPAVARHREYIAEQTLATEFAFDGTHVNDFVREEELAGAPVTISLTRVE